jgi:hypothetical protein
MARVEDFASFKSELMGTLDAPHIPRPNFFASLRSAIEYFEIHVHKKCTKLNPEEFKAIALMSLVTLKKNSIRTWAQLYCSVKKKHKKV